MMLPSGFASVSMVGATTVPGLRQHEPVAGFSRTRATKSCVEPIADCSGVNAHGAPRGPEGAGSSTNTSTEDPPSVLDPLRKVRTVRSMRRSTARTSWGSIAEFERVALDAHHWLFEIFPRG